MSHIARICGYIVVYSLIRFIELVNARGRIWIGHQFIPSCIVLGAFYESLKESLWIQFLSWMLCPHFASRGLRNLLQADIQSLALVAIQCLWNCILDMVYRIQPACWRHSCALVPNCWWRDVPSVVCKCRLLVSVIYIWILNSVPIGTSQPYLFALKNHSHLAIYDLYMGHWSKFHSDCGHHDDVTSWTKLKQLFRDFDNNLCFWLTHHCCKKQYALVELVEVLGGNSSSLTYMRID